MTRRVELLPDDVGQQAENDLYRCVLLSLHFGKSAHLTDVIQSVIFMFRVLERRGSYFDDTTDEEENKRDRYL